MFMILLNNYLNSQNYTFPTVSNYTAIQVCCLSGAIGSPAANLIGSHAANFYGTPWFKSRTGYNRIIESSAEKVSNSFNWYCRQKYIYQLMIAIIGEVQGPTNPGSHCLSFDYSCLIKQTLPFYLYLFKGTLISGAQNINPLMHFPKPKNIYLQGSLNRLLMIILFSHEKRSYLHDWMLNLIKQYDLTLHNQVVI